MLQTRYHSQTPYRLGPEQIVKYVAQPCQWLRPPRRDRTEGMLREGLREELSLGDACFELLVQLQVTGRNMPVEDPTVEWSEADSPLLPVARIVIPKQVFDSPEQDRFCEALSFTPWHALPAHEPVGGLNRLRRAVYQEVSRYRHARSDGPRSEPRGSCLDLTGRSCAELAAGCDGELFARCQGGGARAHGRAAAAARRTAQPPVQPRREAPAAEAPSQQQPPAAEPPATEPPAEEPPASRRNAGPQSRRPTSHRGVPDGPRTPD